MRVGSFADGFEFLLAVLAEIQAQSGWRMTQHHLVDFVAQFRRLAQEWERASWLKAKSRLEVDARVRP